MPLVTPRRRARRTHAGPAEERCTRAPRTWRSAKGRAAEWLAPPQVSAPAARLRAARARPTSAPLRRATPRRTPAPEPTVSRACPEDRGAVGWPGAVSVPGAAGKTHALRSGEGAQRGRTAARAPAAQPREPTEPKTLFPKLPGREDAVSGFRFRWRLRSPRPQAASAGASRPRSRARGLLGLVVRLPLLSSVSLPRRDSISRRPQR